MHQVVEAGAGARGDEQDRYQVAFAQRLLEGRVQFGGRRVGTFLEVAGQQRLVLFD